ncbi:Peptidoglycan-N-acetylglucosamine deacetylase [compost metagenome]
MLKEAGIKATFFVLGEHVKKYPEMTRRIVKEGHSIGNHSYNHKYNELYTGFTGFAEQVLKTDKLIYDTTGVRTTLFRAPGGTYGHFDQGYFDAMAAAGYQVHDWNVDSGDSSRLGVPASEVLAEVKSSVLKDKLTVLLHDSIRHEESVKALPDIIAYYKDKGYVFDSLTVNTEPIQFKAAKKLKWERAAVTEAQIKRFAAQSDALARIADQQEPKLVIHQGERRLELEPEAYGLREGAIEVSLLKLMDWLGASTTIDKQEKAVTVSLNDMNIEWSYNETETGEASGAEQFMVPVRAALHRLGIGITHYVYDERQREIWLAAS